MVSGFMRCQVGLQDEGKTGDLVILLLGGTYAVGVVSLCANGLVPPSRMIFDALMQPVSTISILVIELVSTRLVKTAESQHPKGGSSSMRVYF